MNRRLKFTPKTTGKRTTKPKNQQEEINGNEGNTSKDQQNNKIRLGEHKQN